MKKPAPRGNSQVIESLSPTPRPPLEDTITQAKRIFGTMPGRRLTLEQARKHLIGFSDDVVNWVIAQLVSTGYLTRSRDGRINLPRGKKK